MLERWAPWSHAISVLPSLQGEKLWEVLKTDPERCGTLVSACAGLVALLAGLVQPYMPDTSARIAAQLGVSEADISLRRTEALAATPHRILLAGANFHRHLTCLPTAVPGLVGASVVVASAVPGAKI